MEESKGNFSHIRIEQRKYEEWLIISKGRGIKMLKVGIFSDEISQDFEHTLKVIEELEIEYVELRSMWGKSLMDLPSNELKRVKELIEEKNLKVSVIASPFLKCHLREEETEKTRGGTHLFQEKSYTKHLEILEHSFELAEMFGTHIVRAFSFWKKGNLTEDILEEIVQRFKTPVRRAEEENIILALENEHDCFIGSGKESRRFLERISSKNVGLIWDPGNAFFAGETPYPDGYNLVKDQIVHVHIKDTGKDEKGKPFWLPVGKGGVNFKGQLQALEEDNFQGVVSLETHYIPEDGSAEDGTRESFAGMSHILESL